MKVEEARKLIGKVIEWETHSTRWITRQKGLLEGVKGRNLLVDGDYKWLPDMKNIKEAA